MNKVEEAVKTFKSGFNCSQSIISTYAPELGLNRDLALLISSGFGGGLGRTGEVCGVVTGAIMTLGLKYGYTVFSNEAKERVYSMVREFITRFKEKDNSIFCKELLGVDINTPEGRERAHIICPELVRDAAEILEEMLKNT
ncbi:MAG: C-GCAxxG-C-C family protein [bacterium]|nr:C-GCAxxG-C-C family protein [bacterium]